MLEFRILNPLEVVGSAGPVHLGGPKQRATLAILLLNANRVVSIDRIADQLYAGRAPVTAATQVHRQISELRGVLGPDARLETRSPGYVIRVAAEQLDLKRFERLTEEAGRALARGAAETAFALQRNALALWRYTEPGGMPALRAEIAGMYSGIEPDEVVTGLERFAVRELASRVA